MAPILDHALCRKESFSGKGMGLAICITLNLKLAIVCYAFHRVLVVFHGVSPSHRYVVMCREHSSTPSFPPSGIPPPPPPDNIEPPEEDSLHTCKLWLCSVTWTCHMTCHAS